MNQPFDERNLGTLLKWCLVLTASLSLTLGIAIYGVIRTVGDEQKTCMIQAQGLPAGHELTAVMEDIYALLTIKPTTRAEKLAVKEESPHVKQIISDMTKRLAKYKRDEAKQPHSRVC